MRVMRPTGWTFYPMPAGPPAPGRRAPHHLCTAVAATLAGRARLGSGTRRPQMALAAPDGAVTWATRPRARGRPREAPTKPPWWSCRWWRSSWWAWRCWGGAGALAWLYFGSEVLLAVAVELAFSVASARALMGAERAGWLGAAWRLTGKPLLGALLCAVALGAALDHWLPQARSLPHAVQLLRGR